MVGGGNEHARTSKIVELLKEGGDDALQLAVVGALGTLLADRVELVEEDDPGLSGGGLKDRREILGGVAEERGDDGREIDDGELSAELSGKRLGGCGLATTRGSGKEQGATGGDTVLEQEDLAFELKPQLTENLGLSLGQEEIIEADEGIA